METGQLVDGVVFLLLTAYFIYDAYSVLNGDVRVAVNMADDKPNVEYWLSEDEADVAVENSRAAAIAWQ